MFISWDEKRREDNWLFRNVDFAEAIGIFDSRELIKSIDGHVDYDQERVQAPGKTGGDFSLAGLYMRRYPLRHSVEGLGPCYYYLVKPNTQLDVGVNVGLNKDAPDYQLYTGISQRF